MISEKPKKDFVELLKRISDEIEEINNNTPNTLGTIEPEWWLDMMDIQRKVIECKMKYLEYEV